MKKAEQIAEDVRKGRDPVKEAQEEVKREAENTETSLVVKVPRGANEEKLDAIAMKL